MFFRHIYRYKNALDLMILGSGSAAFAAAIRAVELTTMAEAYKIAALSFKKDVTKLSCCAE